MEILKTSKQNSETNKGESKYYLVDKGSTGRILEGFEQGSKYVYKLFRLLNQTEGWFDLANSFCFIEIISTQIISNSLQTSPLCFLKPKNLDNTIPIQIFLNENLEENYAKIRFDPANEDLSSFLKRTNDEIRMKHFSTLFSQILFGIFSLHEKNLMHRDIKPKNILVFGDNNSFRVCDYGFTCPVDLNGKVYSSTICGTTKYQPLEVGISSSNQFQNGDLFSFGITLIEYLCGTSIENVVQNLDPGISNSLIVIPKFWSRQNILELLNSMEAKPFMKFIEKQNWIHLKEILELLLECDPKKRPSASSLVSNIKTLEMFPLLKSLLGDYQKQKKTSYFQNSASMRRKKISSLEVLSERIQEIDIKNPILSEKWIYNLHLHNIKAALEIGMIPNQICLWGPKIWNKDFLNYRNLIYNILKKDFGAYKISLDMLLYIGDLMDNFVSIFEIKIFGAYLNQSIFKNPLLQSELKPFDTKEILIWSLHVFIFYVAQWFEFKPITIQKIIESLSIHLLQDSKSILILKGINVDYLFSYYFLHSCFYYGTNIHWTLPISRRLVFKEIYTHSDPFETFACLFALK